MVKYSENVSMCFGIFPTERPVLASFGFGIVGVSVNLGPIARYPSLKKNKK
jgi:hypothetical protein